VTLSGNTNLKELNLEANQISQVLNYKKGTFLVLDILNMNYNHMTDSVMIDT